MTNTGSILFEGAALKFFYPLKYDITHAVNDIPSATLRFGLNANSSDFVKNPQVVDQDLKLCAPGSNVTIHSPDRKLLLFKGIVVEQRLKIGSPEINVGEDEGLTLIVRHPLQSLRATHRSQIFADKTDAEIIKEILQSQNIKVEKCEGLDVKHLQMIQFMASDWQFIRSRLAANGVWLAPSTEGVSIIKPTLTAKANHTVLRKRAKKSDVALGTAEWTFVNAEMPAELTMTSWDVAKQEMTKESKAVAVGLGKDIFNSKDVVPLNKTKWELACTTTMSPAEYEALAKGRLLEQQNSGVQASFTVQGGADYKIGETLEISGFGKLDGTGLINEVQHSFDQTGSQKWLSTLSLGQRVLRDVGASPLPTAAGLYIGVVEKFKSDPDSLNRLQVKVPALKFDNKPLWARFAAPYASKDSGLCLYPEAGDEVVLGFFAEDPRFPVILGAMHNPKNQAPFAPSHENKEKGFVYTRGEQKQQLVFNVEEVSALLQSGKETLELKKGMAFDSAEKVTMTAAKDMTLSANKLDLKGKNTVNIKGAKIDLTN